MGRVSLLGRLMLIVMGALSVLVLTTIALDHWQRGRERSPYPTSYPRIDQAADIFTLLRDAPPAQEPAILRAVTGESLRAEIGDAIPALGPDLIRAPRIEARLQRLTGVPAEAIRAYTEPGLLHGVSEIELLPGGVTSQPRGPMVRADLRLADGRHLTLTTILRRREVSLSLLGQPLGLWVAVLGVAVTGLALLGARNEIAPLRRLTETVSRFDGRVAGGVPDPRGAPEIRRLAQAVAAMQARIATLLGERSLLIGAISHDLKTYLTRLRLRADGLREPERRERMIADLDAMTDLIETSLAFARGTTTEARRAPVDLADLVAVEVAEQAALGGSVTLSGEEVPDAVVTGDPVALRRVVANLIQNAVKFGRSTAAVAVERTGATCRVVVEDDGPGIDAAERAAVFGPFYRVERSRSRQTGGSGLGLAITRQIVEAHGGTVEIGTAALGGARLTVALPAAPARLGTGGARRS